MIEITSQVQCDKNLSLQNMSAKLWARAREDFARPQFKKQFTLGRSMIEMLGVLAIIGVLSIGALVGLKYAFMKHQSNLIIEDVKLAGFIVKDGLFETLPISEEKSLNGYFTPQTSYSFTTFKETDTTYAVVIDGVSENLCLDLKKRKVEWLEEIRANGKENTCRAGDSNAMSFFFNTDLNVLSEDVRLCAENADCGACGRCENRKCVDDNSLCTAAESPICKNGTCTSCGENQLFVNAKCVSCSDFSYGQAKIEQCHMCATALQSSNWCYSCEKMMGTNLANISRDECQRCPTRVFLGVDESNGRCHPAAGGYLNPYPATVRKADCEAHGLDWYQGSETDVNTGEKLGWCGNCKMTTYLPSDKTVCEGVCGGLEWLDGKCVCPSGTFGTVGDGCQSCGATSSFIASSLECKRCSNRFLNGGRCYLCPTGLVASSDGLSCVNPS